MDKELLKKGAAQLGLELTPKQLDQFFVYEAVLEEGKARANLTSIQGEDIVPLHFLDSLTGMTCLNMVKGGSLLDLGSGAGFPGLPIKIMLPDVRMTLIEATGKKADTIPAARAGLPQPGPPRGNRFL